MISSLRSGPSLRSLFARTQTGIDGPTCAGAAIRILIFDDIEAWHCVYIGVLRRDPQSEIVAIARDGMEAIQQTWELKPDVVLVDVGLGRVDRLKLARQMSEVSPNSRLLLLGTAEPSQMAEIAQLTGAYGYVSKRNLVVDLLTALQCLATGQRFLSEDRS